MDSKEQTEETEGRELGVWFKNGPEGASLQFESMGDLAEFLSKDNQEMRDHLLKKTAESFVLKAVERLRGMSLGELEKELRAALEKWESHLNGTGNPFTEADPVAN